TPRVWAEVDLSAIRHNITAMQSLVGPDVDVMPVIKADAYGHGMRQVAKAALATGIRWLGVATVEEGSELRKIATECISPDDPATQRPNHPQICVLSPFAAGESEEIVARRLIPVVSDFDAAQALSRAAQTHDS